MPIQSESITQRITLDSLVMAAPNQVSSDLAGEAVILHLGQGVYYGLDEVGARVWSLIQQPRTPAQIRDAILDEYDVTSEQCERDVLKLLADLASSELIEVRSAGAA